MNATLSLSAAFSDGSKPIAASLVTVAPYAAGAQRQGGFDLTESLAQQDCPLDFGSIEAATALIIQNDAGNQEMFLSLNGNSWTHGLAPGGVFGVASPTVGDLPITEAKLVMKGSQVAASSFNYAIFGDP